MVKSWRRLAVLGIACWATLAARPAYATFHLWKLNEFFSSSDGAVQFIELTTTDDDQDHLGGQTISSTRTGHFFTFPANLPNMATGGHAFLLGTAAFAALPGAVAPDYTIPASFFSPLGDSINFANVDLVTFGAGVPTDGQRSLARNLTASTNSPRDFANQIGSVRVSPAHFWRNLARPLDVDDKGTIQPLDALLIINAINAGQATALPIPPTGTDAPPPYLDTSGDDLLTAQDVLLVINELNAQGSLAFQPQAALVQGIPEPSSGVLAALAGLLSLIFCTRRTKLKLASDERLVQENPAGRLE